jgi:hypothetical protein
VADVCAGRSCQVLNTVRRGRREATHLKAGDVLDEQPVRVRGARCEIGKDARDKVQEGRRARIRGARRGGVEDGVGLACGREQPEVGRERREVGRGQRTDVRLVAAAIRGKIRKEKRKDEDETDLADESGAVVGGVDGAGERVPIEGLNDVGAHAAAHERSMKAACHALGSVEFEM